MSDSEETPPYEGSRGLQATPATARTFDDVDSIEHVPSVSHQVYRIDLASEQRVNANDLLASEVPVALEYNGISYAVMLATPTDLEDFALGFSLTEGIIEQASQAYDIQVQPACDRSGIVISIDIASARANTLKQRRRAMSGRTGCGLCGVEALPDAVRAVPAVEQAHAMSLASVFRAFQSMRQHQHLFQATGATHAAAWSNDQGTIRMVREDVGRHNALDKLVGALYRQGFTPAAPGALLVSSRASFEMVQKTAAAGIGMLASMSAPTSLAVGLADRLNVALAGFFRQRQCVLYAHADRFLV